MSATPRHDGAILTERLFGHTGHAHAVEHSGGRITAIKPLAGIEEAESYRASRPDALDAAGLLVLPGLIDAHAHAIATGMTMLGGSARDIASLDALEGVVRAEAGRGTAIVRVTGFDQRLLSDTERPLLTRAWLDGLVPERPLFIKSVEGHSSWFNTRGWEHVGVGPKLAELAVEAERAQQMRDSGRVYGQAYEELTTPLYDSFSFEERREGMRRVLETAARVGLTGIHCLEGYGDFRREDFSLILDLDGRGCDLTLYARDSTPQLASELSLTRFGGCWCVDGAIGSHTAAIGKPYADKPESCGELYFSDDELLAWVESGLMRGMQVCNHAIGDAAIEQILRIYELLAPKYDLAALRPRADHFILGDERQARWAAHLGVLSAMQPAFDAAWGGANGGYSVRLGADRALETNPVGLCVRCGMRIAGSSDAYITAFDPLLGIRAAMNHHNPEHSVDFDTAVRLFSEHAAYLAHQEGSRGHIAEGLGADFTIVDGDETLEGASVAYTVKGGEVVYSAGRSGDGAA